MDASTENAGAPRPEGIPVIVNGQVRYLSLKKRGGTVQGSPAEPRNSVVANAVSPPQDPAGAASGKFRSLTTEGWKLVAAAGNHRHLVMFGAYCIGIVLLGRLWHPNAAAVVLIATVFALIFSNLGKRRPGELSAYSVFNAGHERLPGQLTGAQFDAEIRGLPIPNDAGAGRPAGVHRGNGRLLGAHADDDADAEAAAAAQEDRYEQACLFVWRCLRIERI